MNELGEKSLERHSKILDQCGDGEVTVVSRNAIHIVEGDMAIDWMLSKYRYKIWINMEKKSDQLFI